MKIAQSQQLCELSIREFSEFRAFHQSPNYFGNLQRAQIGTLWHKELEKQTSRKHPNTRFEVPIAASYKYKNWTFAFKGRIDQVIPTEHQPIIQEIKSTSQILPIANNDLENQYKPYFIQAATYLLLSEYDPQLTTAEQCNLVFVNIDSGKQQSVTLDTSKAQGWFFSQLDTLIDYLNGCKLHTDKLFQVPFNPAFEHFREGQEPTLSKLKAAANTHPVIAFEAPTGFGKTGIALQHALDELQQGKIRRIIYLSSKTSGQSQALQQIAWMRPESSPLRYIQMRSKDAHLNEVLTSRAVSPSHPHPPQLFRNDGSLDEEAILKASDEHQLSTYDITRACLPYADIWIADYNYIFSTQCAHLFEQTPQFSPEQTLLIIDEAHNLSDRIETAYSECIDVELIEMLLSEIDSNKLHLTKSIECFEELLLLFEGIKACTSIDDESLSAYKSLLESLYKQYFKAPIEHPSDNLEHGLRKIFHAHKLYQDETLQTISYAANAEQIDTRCISAHPIAAKTLKPYKQCILMSATLHPLNYFKQQIGLPSLPLVIGETPWRNSCYDIAIDTTGDTRYKHRNKNAQQVAGRIMQMTHTHTAPIAAFFPSYAYAKLIQEHVSQQDSLLIGLIQPRSSDPDEQQAFINEAIFSAHIIYLVMGSHFAESIDYLGGKIEAAFVAGPALPEFNNINQKKLELHTGTKEEAFQSTYIQPGMRKIRQAIGRLVRNPQHRARVLLYDSRFAETSYLQHLENDYQATILHSNDEVASWMNIHNFAHPNIQP